MNGFHRGRPAEVLPPRAVDQAESDPERAVRSGRGGGPRLLAEFLPATLDKLGLSAGLEDARVFADWESAVGGEIARVARPHRLDGATLIVHVRNSAWMAELSLRRSEILERLNAGRGRRPIRQIVFRIDTGPER